VSLGPTLWVLPFHLQIFVPPIAFCSLSSSWAGTVDQLVADVASRLVLTPPEDNAVEIAYTCGW
jgi:hypothetical protein